MVSKVKVGKIRIEKNRDFCVVLACASVNHCSLTAYKTNGHKRPPTFINREFWENLCKIHAISEILAFSIRSLFWRTYAISTCLSLGKSRVWKNPAIKDWISENKKNGRPFSLNSKFSLKLKWLQVNQSWSSLRYLAKISLFSAILKTENIFLFKWKDFFSETNAKCTETQLNLRL